MNTANLQLKGILLALRSLLEALKAKGLLNQQEIENALLEAEAMACAEGKTRDELSKSNAEAICFPIRFLREANSDLNQGISFSSITQLVAERANES
jgi:hypothetical protein